jgi:1-acyl-sn-glycerol-3-phosphate acyltransferase
MKYIITGMRAFLVLANTAFQISCLLIDELIHGKSIERRFKHRRRWARWSIKILGIKIDELRGTLSSTNVLIISNHRTLLDPVIQCAFMDAYIIAKAEVGQLPIISQGAKLTGIILVKRERLRSRVAARDKTKEILERQQNVLVYAEGTTGTTETSGAFKPGTFAIATELGLSVIPVAIEYPDSKDYWYEDSMGKQMLRQIGVWQTRVKVRIGSPIYHEDTKALMKMTQAAIDQDLKEMQRGWSKIFPA